MVLISIMVLMGMVLVFVLEVMFYLVIAGVIVILCISFIASIIHRRRFERSFNKHLKRHMQGIK